VNPLTYILIGAVIGSLITWAIHKIKEPKFYTLTCLNKGDKKYYNISIPIKNMKNLMYKEEVLFAYDRGDYVQTCKDLNKLTANPLYYRLGTPFGRLA
jgi:hypothetical protein